MSGAFCMQLLEEEFVPLSVSPRARRQPWLIAFATLVAIALPSGVLAVKSPPAPPVTIQFLNTSDWHAQLDPISVSGVGNVGGAAVLSAYWQADRTANPNTITLTGGDDFGASPPLANFFDEETAVLAQNLMGIDVATFGNHNFDRGIDHLQAMIDLADYQYVSANLRNRDANLSGVEDFALFEVGGVTVGVVGITNPEAPSLVFPGNFGTIEVASPYAAANKARVAAKKAGADIVVAVIHAGVTGFDGLGQPTGELIDFANSVGGFAVIFGDHTDVQYSGIINDQLVLENRSRGLTYARTDVTVDPSNGRVISRSTSFVTPRASAVTPDPAIVSMLDPYRTQLAAIFDEPVGVATGLFPRGSNVERLREVAIGNLIADAYRARYGTQLAFMNGGSIRAPLPSTYLPADTTLRRTSPGYAAGPPYDLVVGDIYSTLPFGNIVVTRTVTGAQLWAVLEHSVSSIPAASGKFGQVSGFRFRYDSNLAPGSRVLSVTLDGGTPILPDGTLYTFATTNFTNAGGDGYTMLADGQGVSRELDAQVLQAYIEGLGTITPVIEGRILNCATDTCP